jgi:hypothetical protein
MIADVHPAKNALADHVATPIRLAQPRARTATGFGTAVKAYTAGHAMAPMSALTAIARRSDARHHGRRTTWVARLTATTPGHAALPSGAGRHMIGPVATVHCTMHASMTVHVQVARTFTNPARIHILVALAPQDTILQTAACRSKHAMWVPGQVAAKIWEPAIRSLASAAQVRNQSRIISATDSAHACRLSTRRSLAT